MGSPAIDYRSNYNETWTGILRFVNVETVYRNVPVSHKQFWFFGWHLLPFCVVSFFVFLTFQGMKVGGKRTIKIPPNKGYGDEWFKGTIPPNAHLQFECELISIAQTPQEEFMEKLNNFGVARAIGLVLCGGYLALSPFFTEGGFY